jgi:hypothetical protein
MSYAVMLHHSAELVHPSASGAMHQGSDLHIVGKSVHDTGLVRM